MGLLVALSLLGLLGGLALLARGLGAYRAAHRVAGIGTSRIATAAAGEVRLVGTIVADVMTLVSPLQGIPCVYHRSRVREGSGSDSASVFSAEEVAERAVGFRLRDASGEIRVFPRGAHWDAPVRFEGSDGWTGSPPPGLRLHAGPSHRPVVEDREAQIAALLAVGPGAGSPDRDLDGIPGGDSGAIWSSSFGLGSPRRRDYEERRLEPGDLVTIVGSVLPFRDVADPATADRYDPGLALDDPEVARSVAEARAAGILLATPEEAWGNAAIPGFGIGRPARAPELDPDATAPALAAPAEAAAAASRFDISPGELVVAASPEHPLAILSGTPGEAHGRASGRVAVGIAGAALAIISVLALALAVQGRLG